MAVKQKIYLQGSGNFQQLKSEFLGTTKSIKAQNVSIQKLNQSYSANQAAQQRLREKTTGLRREVSKFRNDLLLLSFAFSLVKTSIIDSISASERWRNSMLGLSSVANSTGNSISMVKQAAIELTNDGLLTLADAGAGLKNLLATGFDLPQAIQVMKTFKDAAAFNRQGTLEFGNAIVRATEGVKNQISALVDNVGITKNLSVIMKEYGYTMQDLSDATKGAAARQALYNGLVKEGSLFMGDAAKLANQYSGAVSRLENVTFKVQANFGSLLTQGVGVGGIFLELNERAIALAESFGKTIDKNKIAIVTKLEQTYKNLSGIMDTVTQVFKDWFPIIQVIAKYMDFLTNTTLGRMIIYWKLLGKAVRSVTPYFEKFTKEFIKIKKLGEANILKGVSDSIKKLDTTMANLQGKQGDVTAKLKAYNTTLASTKMQALKAVKSLKTLNETTAGQRWSLAMNQAKLEQVVQSQKDLVNVQNLLKGRYQLTTSSIEKQRASLERLNKQGVLSNKEYKMLDFRLKQVSKSIVGLNNSYKKFNTRFATLNNLLNKGSKGIAKFHLGLKQMGGVLNYVKGAMLSLGGAIAQVMASMIIVNIAGWLLNLINTTDKYNEKLNEMIDGLSKLQDALSETKQAIDANVKSIENYSLNAVRSILSVGKFTDATNTFKELLTKAGKEGAIYEKQLKKILDEYKRNPKDIDNLILKIEELNDAMAGKQLKEGYTKYDEYVTKLKELEQTLTDIFNRNKALGVTELAWAKLLDLDPIFNQFKSSAKGIFQYYTNNVNRLKKYNEELMSLSGKEATGIRLNNREIQRQAELEKLITREKQVQKYLLVGFSETEKKVFEQLYNAYKISGDMNEQLRGLNKNIKETQLTSEKIGNIWQKNADSMSEKALKKQLITIDQMINKLKTLGDKKVKIDLLDPDKIHTSIIKSEKDLDSFIGRAEKAFAQFEGQGFYWQEAGTSIKKYFNTFDEWKKHILSVGVAVQGAFLGADTTINKSASEIIRLLLTIKKYNPEKYKNLFGNIVTAESLGRVREYKSRLLALIAQLDKVKAKLSEDTTSMFYRALGNYQKDIVKADQARIEDLKHFSKSEVKAWYKQAREAALQIKRMDISNILDKMQEKIVVNVKVLQQKREAIRFIEQGYKTLSGTVVGYYTKANELAMKFSDVESQYTKRKLELEKKLEDIVKNRVDIEENQYISSINYVKREIKEIEAYVRLQQQMLVNQEQLNLLKLTEAAQLKAARGGLSMEESFTGINFKAQTIQIAQSENEKNRLIQASQIRTKNLNKQYYQTLVSQHKAGLINETELIKKYGDFKAMMNKSQKDYELAQEEQFQDMKYEIALKNTEQIMALGEKLFSWTQGVNEREMEMMRAKYEAQQQLIQDDYQARFISKRQYDEKMRVLDKKRALEEKIATRKRSIEQKREISETLKTQAKMWAIQAIAAAAIGEYKKAAGLAAAATAAGVAGAAMAQGLAKQEAELEKYNQIQSSRIDKFRGYGAAGYTTPGVQAATVGGSITAQEYKVVVSPSVTIQGDTVLIGNVGVEELKMSIGNAVVQTTKSAIENGEINIGQLTEGNVGG